MRNTADGGACRTRESVRKPRFYRMKYARAAGLNERRAQPRQPRRRFTALRDFVFAGFVVAGNAMER